jgi:hypothetical protein
VEFDIPTGSKLANMAQYAIFLACDSFENSLECLSKDIRPISDRCDHGAAVNEVVGLIRWPVSLNVVDSKAAVYGYILWLYRT